MTNQSGDDSRLATLSNVPADQRFDPARRGRSADRALLRGARGAWAALAVIGGATFGDALADHSRAVQLVGTTALWLGWSVVVLALAVPTVVGLTAARVVAPMAFVASLVAAIRADSGLASVVCVAAAAVATGCLVTAELGTLFVQAAAYGDEQRFVLRPTVTATVGIALTWPVWCASTLAAPLLLAAQAWLWGLLTGALAVALSFLLGRSYHRLTQRWLVLVPAGLVVRDPLVLADTVMFRRNEIAHIGLALAGTGAADCTGPAAGHAVEIRLFEPATVVFAPTREAPDGRAIHATALLVAPSRPGRALVAARARRLPMD
jgi:hypothetical protein